MKSGYIFDQRGTRIRAHIGVKLSATIGASQDSTLIIGLIRI